MSHTACGHCLIRQSAWERLSQKALHCVERRNRGCSGVSHPTPGGKLEPPRNQGFRRGDGTIIQKEPMPICPVRNDSPGSRGSFSPACGPAAFTLEGVAGSFPASVFSSPTWPQGDWLPRGAVGISDTNLCELQGGGPTCQLFGYKQAWPPPLTHPPHPLCGAPGTRCPVLSCGSHHQVF